MGKAIVASNIGWAKEMIDDGDQGFLVDPKNHIEFAGRVSQFLENKGLAQRMGKMARERALNEFEAGIIAERSLNYYRQFI